jgi:plasmid stability protein
MGQILIRNLDDAVLAALKRRARDHQTSAEEEARRALAASVNQVSKEEWLAKADALRKRIGPLPGPSSTEILRADRDRDEFG